MGFTAAGIAILIGIVLLAIVIYRFRDPRRHNARKTVRETTGSGSPHDKIE